MGEMGAIWRYFLFSIKLLRLLIVLPNLFHSQIQFMLNAIILSQWGEKITSLSIRYRQMKQRVGLTLLEPAR